MEYGLRDYGIEGQLGQEKTPQEYISKLMAIMDECKRVLKKTGSLWLNIGDSYNGNGVHRNGLSTGNVSKRVAENKAAGQKEKIPTIQEKSLIGIPERFVIAMTDSGWIRRNTVIWFKNNPIPSSALDRFTNDFEYFYFFTKNTKYYFETQYEDRIGSIEKDIRRIQAQRQQEYNTKYTDQRGYDRPVKKEWIPKNNGRIKRCVWKIPVQSFKEAHFAVFPEALITTPIKACCPLEICNKCGKPKIVMVEENRINTRPGLNIGNGKSGKDNDPNQGLHTSDLSKYRQSIIRTIMGYKTQCNCNTGFHSGVVLDPFIGAGTTGVVAKKLGRHYVGIEANPKYIEIAEKRIGKLLESFTSSQTY